MLQNAHLVATVGFDMAENEPSEVWETSRILRRLSVGGGRLPEFQLFSEIIQLRCIMLYYILSDLKRTIALGNICVRSGFVFMQ